METASSHFGLTESSPPRQDGNPRCGLPFSNLKSPITNHQSFWLAALIVATLAAYRPAWNGGLVWDDDAHVTAPALRTAEGLRRIWLEPGATQQYYPLVHSAFWVIGRVSGERTLAYHLVNILLHATSAFLIALLLRRLAIPGAALAALVFALHPVHVESVAWISELKNTLSGVLYLASALAYVRFDRTRNGRSYAVALVLFLGALLSKSVTATLPAALLVVFWWQRGRIEWRKDISPLVPFFVVGVTAGLYTAWFERHFIGAQGYDFTLSAVERCLIAGRAFWFYLQKLVWPFDLMFIYPRWTVSAAEPWQYAYPLAAVTVILIAWMIRKRTRAPLAALLLFAGTLFPALGFVNVFPFRYSFVADHFQYLASIPVIALACAAIVTSVKNARAANVEAAAMLAVGIPLGVLTWRQSADYASAETLYRATLDNNPSCWMCQNNLAMPLLGGSRDDIERAVGLIRQSLQSNPNHVEALNNLGVAYRKLGRFEDAFRAHERAVELSPGSAVAHDNLGGDAHALGRFDEALAHYDTALRLDPRSADALRNRGATLLELGRLDEAAGSLEASLGIEPDSAEAHHSLGTVLLRARRPAEAIAQFNEAVRLDPAHAEARNNLGMALEMTGRLPEAAAQYAEAARVKPSAITLDNLGYALLRMGRHDEALAHFESAVRLQPDYAPARISLGTLLLDAGRVEEALQHYRVAVEHSQGSTAAEAHNGMGVALASSGAIDSAIGHFRDAVRLRPDYPEARQNLARAISQRGRR
jgi:tetratricopeptide (TPR) repeat protein